MRRNQNIDEPIISDINITPFVDVLLVLLVIFMITAPLITFDIPVNLPSSKTGKNESNESVDIILTITNDHKIFLDSSPVKNSEIVNALKNKILANKKLIIFIQADKDARYGEVAEMMAMLRNEGFVNLNLVIKNSDV